MLGAKVLDFGLSPQTIQIQLFKYTYLLDFLFPKRLQPSRISFSR